MYADVDLAAGRSRGHACRSDSAIVRRVRRGTICALDPVEPGAASEAPGWVPKKTPDLVRFGFLDVLLGQFFVNHPFKLARRLSATEHAAVDDEGGSAVDSGLTARLLAIANLIHVQIVSGTL